MAKLTKVAQKNDLPPGKAIAVDIEGKRIAVFNISGTYYAIDDECTHDLASLAEGGINDDCTVECPWHGAQFDLKTGKAMTLPAVEAVRTYKVRIQGDQIEVEL